MPTRKPLMISLGFITLPVHRWTVQVFSLLAVIGVTAIVWDKAFPRQVLSLVQANHALAVEVLEYNKHILDMAEGVFDMDRVHIRVFQDGCILVQRRLAGIVTTRLLPASSLMDDDAAQPERHVVPWKPGALLNLDPTPAALAQGQCLNPHPGPFNFAYGAKINQCVVEVWRQFDLDRPPAARCEHVQLFNVCNKSWDTNYDGSPRVRWTQCAH